MTTSSQTLAQWWATNSYSSISATYTYTYLGLVVSSYSRPYQVVVNGSIVTKYSTVMSKTIRAQKRTSSFTFVKTSNPGKFSYYSVIRAGYINGVDGPVGMQKSTSTASILGLQPTDYISPSSSYRIV